MRLIKPFEIAPKSPMLANVIIAISGSLVKFPFAAPARLKPINITIVPVTTGGSSQLIQPIPAARTAKPTSARTTPVKTIPPRAAAIPPSVPAAAIAAAIGPKNAKDEPR